LHSSQDKMLENLAESEARTELATCVSKWRKTIGADLREEVWFCTP
jgi:hypothetical protein